MTRGLAETGLSSAEVAQRVRDGRTNELRTRTSRSAGQILRANVFTIFNAIITTALVLTLVFGHWADALFGFVLVLNTATGTLAEIRAKRALDRLSVLDAPVAHVVRDGHESDVEVGAIVLDDVLRLRAGEQVPADAEVLQVDGLEVDESILTGESDAVRPEVGDTVMSGTTVTSGSAVVRTTAVGADAYANRLATEARRYSVVRSELQEGTNRILTWISWVIVPVGLLVLWSQMRLDGSVSQSLSSGQWRVALVAAVASVVGMVPQGLVLLTSVNFATASLKLARQDVLVQELPAVEVLARVDTLCLDKTGTLTTGRITLREVLGADGEPVAPGPDGDTGEGLPAGDLRDPLLALTGGSEPNATAEAVLTALTDTEVTGSTELHLLPGVSGILPRTHSAVAFSSRRKWSGTVLDGEAWVMGAPEIVLDAADGATALLERARELSEDGVRVVALAHGGSSFGTAPDGDAVLPDGLTAAGLVELTEEVRSDAAQTLGYFREQGVTVKVISGDNPVTVAAVARRAGVQGPDGAAPVALDARELPTEVSDPEDLERLAAALDDAQVLGRVTPEQKKAVVQALHHRSRTVAMTGDGVNDSLALKEADLGIAMGNGAPATKAVARMVLLSGEFSALPGVVAEGRRVMANTERIASLFLAKTVYASLIAVVVAITAISYPFQPRQLTIVSSLTIGIPAFVLALAPNSQRYRAGFLPRVLGLAVPAGLVAGTTTLMTRQWLEMTGAASEQVTTGATLVLVIAGLWLLTLTAKPLLGWRLGLILLMAGAAVLGVLIPVVREFFLLAWPTWRTWTAVAVGGGAAVAGIQALAVARWVLRLQDRVGEHEERRATREG
ncbi:HAD-IC family P-type ATPase [Actinomyces haliotis]|uniref:HAD-IC family P-type ATPase n=1 Tax=Actinomyces haliotis TaxID=1280843 RepID=UPI001890A015|nr:HAD-IC family P-type ATPase [Actinomyces haliotis]